MAKDLNSFLLDYEERYPGDVVHVNKKINSNQEITAIILQLEKHNKYPLLIFHNVINPMGKRSEYPVVTNIFASRTRYARICNTTFEILGRDVFRVITEDRRKPTLISKEDAPVKEIVKIGEDINLYQFPLLIHNDMDAGRYLSAACLISYDPDTNIDNCSIQRGWVKDKNTIRVFIGPKPMHNGWNLYKHEVENRNMKVAFWQGHHPLAIIGGLAKLAYPSSHWEVMGGILQEPLRLVSSESLGDDFLVPADAEIIIEGVIEANKRYAEGPFGEFSGYYGPQILSPQLKVTAITHRKSAIWHNVAAGYMDHIGTGGPPLEGMLWNTLKPRFPSLTNIYMPSSGAGRYHVYLQFRNPGPGEARQAIMLALATRGSLIKHIFTFDDDIDIFNPQDVMWAIATRTQWSRDVMIFPRTKSAALDPSLGPDAIGDIGGIDCTKPWGEPYEERVAINQQVMKKAKLETFISPETLMKIETHRY